MNEEQADAVDKAFDPDYDVAQVFCSHIVPKVLILFVEESPNDGMEFEPYYGEVDDNDKEQAYFVDQAFDLDYDVAQTLCSHNIPKAVILFTWEALNDGMDFEPEDGDI